MQEHQNAPASKGDTSTGKVVELPHRTYECLASDASRHADQFTSKSHLHEGIVR